MITIWLPCDWIILSGGIAMTGWWYTYPSEKYAKVSWDDDIPNWMEKFKMFQTTNQITIWLPYDYHIRRKFRS